MYMLKYTYRNNKKIKYKKKKDFKDEKKDFKKDFKCYFNRKKYDSLSRYSIKQ